MKMIMNVVRLLIVVFALVCPRIISAEDWPLSQGWVSDFAGVLSVEEKEKITAVITELEIKTSAEIAVVTRASIAPYSEFDYAQRLFDDWKIGKKGRDNGVLILLAVKERAWRIHTGYGVEGALPDTLVEDIGQKQMVPWFKEGQYGEGLYRGVVAVARTIAKEEGVSLSTLQGLKLKAPKHAQHYSLLFCLFVFIFFVIWNIPWPVFIGLPFTLVFASGTSQGAAPVGFAIMAGYVCSMLLRYRYWAGLPVATRPALWKVMVFGMLVGVSLNGKGPRRPDGGFSGESDGGFSGGGGFGGGSSGGGGAGGRF